MAAVSERHAKVEVKHTKDGTSPISIGADDKVKEELVHRNIAEYSETLRCG